MSEDKCEGGGFLFSWKLFFSDVFTTHPKGGVEERLSWGMPHKVPRLQEIPLEFPRPWLFIRLLLVSVIAYFFLEYVWLLYENPKLVPGVIFVGCFAVPCSVLLLFFEINILKNVSIIRVSGAFFLGAIISLALTHPLDSLAQTWGFSAWLSASVAGPVEETAKLATAILLLRMVPRKTVFTGLLIGAAVGAGFAAFESAGYAYSIISDGLNFICARLGLLTSRGVNVTDFEVVKAVQDVREQVSHNIRLRGLMSPFGHVVWTALSTAAICRASISNKITSHSFQNAKFYVFFFLVVVLHMVWNSPLGSESMTGSYLKYGLLGLIAWIAVAKMITHGLKQVKALKLAADAGDSSVLSESELNARAKDDTPMYYNRGGDKVHGPVSYLEIQELAEAGVIDVNTKLSDGGDWHKYSWWRGDDRIGQVERVDLWAWAIVLWPIVIVSLFLLLDQNWILIAFPIVLWGLATIDHAANRKFVVSQWPKSLWAMMPPVYLFFRMRSTRDKSVKVVVGVFVTIVAIAFGGYTAYYVTSTNEGKAFMSISEEFKKNGGQLECLEVNLVKEISKNVSIYNATLSDGSIVRVTIYQTVDGERIKIQSKRDE